jgi:hypothetical protein
MRPRLAEFRFRVSLAFPHLPITAISCPALLSKMPDPLRLPSKVGGIHQLPLNVINGLPPFPAP